MTATRGEAGSLTMSAQLAEIHQKIAWHYSQISILKQSANALNPISTLPNELIAKIFEMYAFLEGPPFGLKWTKVMLVCHRWHDVALNEQSLWGFIRDSFTHGMKQIETQLERSGAAPLSVMIDSLDSPLYATVILQHAERLSELNLTGEAASIFAFMNVLSHHRFPLLQSIKLKPRYNSPASTSITFPVALFDGRAPRLTELDLSRISIDWSLLHGLHSLALDLARDITDSPFGKLLSVLEASPALTRVKLGRVIVSHSSTQSYRLVSLPRLERLCIQEKVEFCNLLLRQVTIPPTARVSIYGLGIESGSDITDLLVPLRKHVRAPSAPTLRCLRIDAPGSHLMLSAFTAAAAPNVEVQREAESFLVNTHPPTENLLCEIMGMVLKALPCSNITYLDCRSATAITITSWKAALALLPALETVSTSASEGAVRLFTALAQLSNASLIGGMWPPLRRVHMYAHIWRRIEDGNVDIVTPVLDALRLLLHARQARGTPLEVLEIEEQANSLGMAEAEWEALFELVGRFVRNGEEYDPPRMRREFAEWQRQLLLEDPSNSNAE
ncbi:hypothetical protein DFH06DRAFT_1486478 [Mycena polygramma]|nr:hypothetical protein DFH06DRAFT_1486478 [Mycena polygramma]